MVLKMRTSGPSRSVSLARARRSMAVAPDGMGPSTTPYADVGVCGGPDFEVLAEDAAESVDRGVVGLGWDKHVVGRGHSCGVDQRFTGGAVEDDQVIVGCQWGEGLVEAERGGADSSGHGL